MDTLIFRHLPYKFIHGSLHWSQWPASSCHAHFQTPSLPIYSWVTVLESVTCDQLSCHLSDPWMNQQDRCLKTSVFYVFIFNILNIQSENCILLLQTYLLSFFTDLDVNGINKAICKLTHRWRWSWTSGWVGIQTACWTTGCWTVIHGHPSSRFASQLCPLCQQLCPLGCTCASVLPSVGHHGRRMPWMCGGNRQGWKSMEGEINQLRPQLSWLLISDNIRKGNFLERKYLNHIDATEKDCGISNTTSPAFLHYEFNCDSKSRIIILWGPLTRPCLV